MPCESIHPRRRTARLVRALALALMPVGMAGATEYATNAPALTINRQGLAQRDFSLRAGSGFDAGISLNGLDLRVPWSARRNAELILPEAWLEAPEPMTGAENLGGFAAGTLRRETKAQSSRMRIEAQVGSKARYRTAAAAETNGVGGFLEWEKARRIDYSANDLSLRGGGARLRQTMRGWTIDVLGAGRYEDFGAQGYYGLPAHVYADERSRDALFLCSAFKGDLDDAYFRAGLLWRESDETYRIPSETFVHDVRSPFGALTLSGRTPEIRSFVLLVRADAERERVSGDPGVHDRFRTRLLLLPEFRTERFVLRAGIDVVAQSAESLGWLPRAQIDWLPGDNLSLYASYAEWLRQPDYRSLLYVDPWHRPDPNLEERRTANLEFGIRQYLSESLSWHAALFRRRTANAYDEIRRAPADPVWYATDLGALVACGAETDVDFEPSERLRLRLHYQWAKKTGADDVWAGRYELDYPEHLLALSGRWRFVPELELFAEQTLRHQTSNPVREGSNFGADALVGLRFYPPRTRHLVLTFQIANPWHSEFQSVPGVRPRPASVAFGLTTVW